MSELEVQIGNSSYNTHATKAGRRGFLVPQIQKEGDPVATMTSAQVPAAPVPAPGRGGVVRWAFFGLVVKLNFHRRIGKIYFAGVVIGSTSAFYLVSVSPLPTFGISLAALGIAWIGTSAMAYLAVRRGQIAAHREWVIRSYVVTYGFVNFRWIVELPFMAGLELERLATAGWLCWTLPLLFTEIILQWRRTAGPRRQGA